MCLSGLASVAQHSVFQVRPRGGRYASSPSVPLSHGQAAWPLPIRPVVDTWAGATLLTVVSHAAVSPVHTVLREPVDAVIAPGLRSVAVGPHGPSPLCASEKAVL